MSPLRWGTSLPALPVTVWRAHRLSYEEGVPICLDKRWSANGINVMTFAGNIQFRMWRFAGVRSSFRPWESFAFFFLFREGGVLFLFSGSPRSLLFRRF